MNTEKTMKPSKQYKTLDTSKVNIDKLLNAFEKAQNIKNSWNEKYDEVCQYIMPEKYNLNPKDKAYKEKNANILCSTGETSAINFVNKMQQVVTPVNSDFIGLEFADYIEGFEGKNIELEKFCKMINAYKNASNFDIAITEFYKELILGTACLLIQGNSFDKPLIFNTIPFKDYSINEGFDGSVDAVYRLINIKEKQIKYSWTDANYIETNEDKTQNKFIDLLEITNYNYETKKYDYFVIVKMTKQIIVAREHETNPFIILRWNKSSGETYGRGVGLVAVPEVKTLNKILDYSLQNLSFSIPIFTAKEDGIFDVDDFLLEPGAINKVPSNDTSNPSIQQLPINTNLDITQYNATNIEMKIKKIMLDNTIPEDGKVRTATEVAERIQDLNVNLTSMFGRLLNEFLYPLTKRIIEVLQIFGYISQEFQLNTIDGYIIKIKIKTALALQNKQEELQKTVNALQILTGFDPTGQALQKFINTNNLIPYMLRLAGVPQEFINTAEESQQTEAQMQQAQQQAQQQAMNDNITMSNAIEQGKANAKNGLQQ